MKAKNNKTRKMVLTAMLACLAFVLNTFVYFPAMAPYPFYTPSAVVGGAMGVAVYFILKRSGMLTRIMSEFELQSMTSKRPVDVYLGKEGRYD